MQASGTVSGISRAPQLTAPSHYHILDGATVLDSQWPAHRERRRVRLASFAHRRTFQNSFQNALDVRNAHQSQIANLDPAGNDPTLTLKLLDRIRLRPVYPPTTILDFDTPVPFNTMQRNRTGPPSARRMHRGGLVVPERLFNTSINVIHGQAQSPLFALPAEIQNSIFEKMQDRDIHVVDRVMASLSCKLIAARLSVARTHVPRPFTEEEKSNKNATDAVKRNRLNFMLRLGPLFDDLSTRRDPTLSAIMAYENTHQIQLGGQDTDQEIFFIENGFNFCSICMEYRRACIFVTRVVSKSWPHTVRFTRCDPNQIPTRSNNTDVAELELPPEVAAKLSQLDFDGWKALPADKNKFPLYKSPNKLKKQLKTSSTTKRVGDSRGSAATSTAGEPSTGSKRKIVSPSEALNSLTNHAAPPAKKKKVSAPRDVTHLEQRKAKEEAKAKAERDAEVQATKEKHVDALEDCSYLPVDSTGEVRLGEIYVCHEHSIDPLKMIGIA